MRYLLAVKAAVSIAAGLAITFSQAHSATVGLLVLGVYGLTYAVLVSAFALRFEAKNFVVGELPLVIVALFVGAFALLNGSAGASFFVVLVSVWGLSFAGFETWRAFRARLATGLGREHLISAVLAAVLGVLFLTVPMDVVSSVGFFSAYLILSSVHTGIAAFSPKP